MQLHILELVIFAGIAFYLINKLISTLGATNKLEKENENSIFGEYGDMKDISKYAEVIDIKNSNNLNALKDYVTEDSLEDILENLHTISKKISNFSIPVFIKNAKAAFLMILEALLKNDAQIVNELVDTRFVHELTSKKDKYYTITREIKDARVSELYAFGNTIFIKVLFKCDKLIEEWVFLKNSNDHNPTWKLSNIIAL